MGNSSRKPFWKTQKIHMVGIGGSGMSGIAELLLVMGFSVTGSDIVESPAVQYLRERGAVIHIGHSRKNLDPDTDVVVFSSAVHPDNPEIVAAREKGIPVIPRAQMLAELMRLKDGIAIAGSHGKSTTTSMVSQILLEAGLDPTVVVGGRFKNVGSGAKYGEGNWMVAEADESDGSFLRLLPVMAIITNIDDDHLDHYHSYEKVKDAFVDFANSIPFYGKVFLCSDDPGVVSILHRITARYATYGVGSADIRAADIELGPTGSSFKVYAFDTQVGRFRINIPGIHNVQNAVGAVALAHELEIPYESMRRALESFQGVARRFDIKGEPLGILVIDDYAHHPREIRTTLSAAKRLAQHRGGSLVTVFQPHRFTRTFHIGYEFGEGFEEADLVLLLGIYPAGEKPIEGVSARIIEKSISERSIPVIYVGHEPEQGKPRSQILEETWVDLRAIFENLLREGKLKKGDVLVFLGAGDIFKLALRFVEEFS